jgi:dolichol-phosphate mannosyltransferase
VVRIPDNAPLRLLSVVIPARDEEGCIASTIEHLYIELRLHNVPHEIIVVDDGSDDETWRVLESAKDRIPTLRPVQGHAPHGFGRALACGFDHMKGDAVVVMMVSRTIAVT